jgi:hypothetical protein
LFGEKVLYQPFCCNSITSAQGVSLPRWTRCINTVPTWTC